MSKHPEWNLNSWLISALGSLILILCSIAGWVATDVIGDVKALTKTSVAYGQHFEAQDKIQSIQRERLDKTLTIEEFDRQMDSIVLIVGPFDGHYGPSSPMPRVGSPHSQP